MPKLTRADFYYGSLLSLMLSNGVKPPLFEENEERRIYLFTTNKGDYLLYMKYVSSRTKRENKDVQLWQFSFSGDEVQKIKELKEKEQGKELLFALICGKQELKESEIAVLKFDEVVDCLGLNNDERTNESYRISIRYEKNAKGLRVYGNGRDEKINGKDNTIKIERDRILGI
ncbi:hypothetical protein SAMN05443428_12310 [Caloramator quimbayensis]|uniref:Uncharacterized protein n=1 Tax=Caloramator quimbayensis TaxID=1147123 RepID=A0A1T4Y514_9CLOT|nr:hypothetical protein [Caloramator quimbayensis]SKA96914.1 hypothetical protein SAMN05443428_12310 [Caloramator quimbayensis]